MRCAHTVSLFLEEILAYSRHMVRFTLGGGTCSHKLASINTFLVNSLIAARYRRPPAPERRDSLLRCVYSLLRNKKEALLKKTPRPPLFPTHVWSFSKRSHPPGRLLSTNVAQVATFSNMFYHQHKCGWMSRDGEWGCSHVCVSLRGSRSAKDISEGHLFHAEKPINYVPPLLPYEFVASVQRLHSRLGRRDGYLLSHSPRDERVSRSLRNTSLFTGWSRGFVNYGRFASTIWWAPGFQNPFSQANFTRFVTKINTSWKANEQ